MVIKCRILRCEKLKIWNSRTQEIIVFTFVSSKFNLIFSFLVFAINFGSGWSGLGKDYEPH